MSRAHFTYILSHSPTLLLLHLRHNSFSSPSFASPRSQDFHLRPLASRPWFDEQQSVGLVRFLWSKGHNPSEIHRDMCGVYWEDCMYRYNVSSWYIFFKATIHWTRRTTWRRCYGAYSLPHTRHTCPFEFHFSQQNSHCTSLLFTLHTLTTVTREPSLFRSSPFSR